MTEQDRNEARRVANELREKFQESGERFSQSDYAIELYEALKPFTAIAYQGFVDGIAKKVDEANARKSQKVEAQGTLFDIGGEFRLGDNERIAKRHAVLADYIAWLKISDDNAAAVAEANRLDHEQYDALFPFLDRGMTVKQAVEALAASESPVIPAASAARKGP